MCRTLARLTWIVVAFACCTPAISSAQNVVLGVLEDQSGWYAGDPNFRTVRVIFKKIGQDWLPFPSDCPDQDCLKRIASSYPSAMTWTIAFDGKNLGQITSRAPKEFKWYASVGQEEITSVGSVPTIGERSSEFENGNDEPAFRPLVANSQPYFKDPDVWKPTQLSSDFVGLLREQFRKKFPSAENCANPDENVPKPWPYADDDIKVLKSYSSRNGWSISRLELEPYRCDGPSDESFVDNWFTISPQHEVKFLDSGLWLIDAGDYDDDGKSELFFARDGRNGYELFYDDFRRHVTFEFYFH